MAQSHLPGIEPPAHPEIEEAAQELKDAKDAGKRAADLIREKESILISRMINAKVQKHRFSANGNYVDIDLTLPNPSVRVKVTSGGEDT